MSQVTLNATSDGFSQFAGWSGACSGLASCVVTVDQAKSVQATFNQVSLDGDWIGTNSQGKIFEFTISAGKLVRIASELLVVGNKCSSEGDVGSQFHENRGLELVNNSFNFPGFNGIFVVGTLHDAHNASGTFRYEDDYCDAIVNLTWQARR